jgi:macrolide-specific efflux system membrane fusion protein
MLSRGKLIAAVLTAGLIGAAGLSVSGKDKSADQACRWVRAETGDIRQVVNTTGVVEPQNRLEIKPTINGRIERIMVSEGDRVRKGDVVALMSSTERAALIDAAQSQDEETREYWENVYKQTPIMSPIDGQIIVRAVEPGQTVTVSDTVLVVSDRLIFKAQFDETDVGRVRLGQKARITLDAYPDVDIPATVDHIAYESELVNNVTIYDVDVLPRDVPEFLRSGMSANIEVVEQERTAVLLVPADALDYEGGSAFVQVRGANGTIEKRTILTGLSNDKDIEVVSGLSVGDNLMIEERTYAPQKKEAAGSPFMPRRGRGR